MKGARAKTDHSDELLTDRQFLLRVIDRQSATIQRMAFADDRPNDIATGDNGPSEEG